jgi:hypothetical protein
MIRSERAEEVASEVDWPLARGRRRRRRRRRSAGGGDRKPLPFYSLPALLRLAGSGLGLGTRRLRHSPTEIRSDANARRRRRPGKQQDHTPLRCSLPTGRGDDQDVLDF